MLVNVIRHLATLPLLQSLDYRISSEELAQADMTGQADCFPSLVHLGIGTDDLIPFLTFFEHISSSNLQTFLIGQTPIARKWDLKPLFDTIAASKSRTNLKELRVEWFRPGISSRPSDISLATLASLFPYHN